MDFAPFNADPKETQDGAVLAVDVAPVVDGAPRLEVAADQGGADMALTKEDLRVFAYRCLRSLDWSPYKKGEDRSFRVTAGMLAKVVGEHQTTTDTWLKDPKALSAAENECTGQTMPDPKGVKEFAEIITRTRQKGPPRR